MDHGVHGIPSGWMPELLMLAILLLAAFGLDVLFEMYVRGYELCVPQKQEVMFFRTVGTQSECTYRRELPMPRFRSGNQGFHHAGAVEVADLSMREVASPKILSGPFTLLAVETSFPLNDGEPKLGRNIWIESMRCFSVV